MPQFVVITQLPLMSKLKEVGAEQEGKKEWRGECEKPTVPAERHCSRDGPFPVTQV